MYDTEEERIASGEVFCEPNKIGTESGIVDIKEERIIRYSARCPECWNIITSTDIENVRNHVIECAEWKAPDGWQEDCEICGSSHRENRCLPIHRRDEEHTPDPDDMTCDNCDWNGTHQELDRSHCPRCESFALC